MASPVRPQPSSSVSSILEQLDELETLMQRMLALPVSPAEADTAPPGAAPAERRPAAETPTAPAARPMEREAPAAAARPPAERTSRQETAVGGEVQERPVPPAAPVVPPERPGGAPARRLPPAAVPERPVPTARGRGSVWRRPLVWLDVCFHRGTMPLGPLGRWLDGDEGRGALGAAGLLILLGALAWGAWAWVARPAGSGAANPPAHLDPAGRGR